MGMDPVRIKELNMPIEGGPLPGYPDVPYAQSCTMDKCMARAKEMMDWDSKYPFRDMGNGKVRGVGVAMAMQGSSIAGVDVGGADIKLNEDGSYTLALGCTDMGTGCDTIMAQIGADCLETPMENIVVFSVDTDISPYDSGSYASSTTYTTGVAVMKACQELNLTPRFFNSEYSRSSIQGGYELAKELFRKPLDYTAVFAATDSNALGMMTAADEMGIDIPGHLSLIGFDNISATALSRIDLTTVDQPKRDMAVQAVDMLRDKIENGTQGYVHQILLPTLIQRGTCRKLDPSK